MDYRHHPNAQSPKNCICVCAAHLSSPINITTTNAGMLLNGLFEIVVQICPDATVYVCMSVCVCVLPAEHRSMVIECAHKINRAVM